MRDKMKLTKSKMKKHCDGQYRKFLKSNTKEERDKDFDDTMKKLKDISK